MISRGASWTRWLGSLAVCAALGGALHAQEPISEPSPATLVYWNRPIATFRAHIRSQSPEERVEAALERLGAMSERTLRGEVRSRLGVVDATDVALVTVGDQLAFAYLVVVNPKVPWA